MDAWTSPSCISILGVAAHFIDKSGKRRTTILALRHLQGMHSGENMAGVLLQIFNEYGIQNRIGYFMEDNQETNDTCIDTLLQQLHPWMTAKQWKKNRLRCAGHIINLCAHAFIMGKDAERIAREMDAAMQEGYLKKIGELWRKCGALGRLHNVTKYIRGSPQRREFFGKQVCGGELAEFDGLEVSSRSCPSTSYRYLPAPRRNFCAKPFFPRHKRRTNYAIFNRLFRTMLHAGTPFSLQLVELSTLRNEFKCSARNTFLLRTRNRYQRMIFSSLTIGTN